jgi:GNAT superfamily N-acetyltransferase
MHLLACVYPSGDPIATLSVVETTGSTALHSSFDISFAEHATVARFTQLAVLKPYRGLHVAVALVQEALSRCAMQHKFDYTWLLFNAARAQSSFLCRSLGFQASDKIFESEFGNMRVLVRKASDCGIISPERAFAGVLPGFERDVA